MLKQKVLDRGRIGRRMAHRTALCAAIASVLLAGNVSANALPDWYPRDWPTPYQKMTFSIDGQSASIFLGDSFYDWTILEGDILTPEDDSKPASGAPGPNPPSYPPVLTSPPGGFIASPPDPLTQAPGFALQPTADFFMELDALSYGRDPIDTPNPQPQQPHYVFSVDEFAIGLPGTAVRAEGALGAQEASADTFITPPKPILPVPPVPGTNRPFTDGDGIAPNGMPGVGLIEPNPPTLNNGFDVQDPGDNLDAVDFGTTSADQYGPVYFSLDSAFTDPLEVGSPPSNVPNYGSAAANGYVGGDVIVGYPAPVPPVPGGPHALYAAAGLLGLDQNQRDEDDLDALKLHENGVDGFQASEVPFDWLVDMGTGIKDMLLFSVRRNSDIIGTADSIFGIQIEEGDVLTTPCAAGSLLPSGVICVGGGAPGIFTAAEWLGLATVRSGTGMSWGIVNPQWGVDLWADDLDALDQIPTPGTIALLGLGLAGLGAARRRRSI